MKRKTVQTIRTSGTRRFREDFAGRIHAFQGRRYYSPRVEDGTSVADATLTREEALPLTPFYPATVEGT